MKANIGLTVVGGIVATIVMTIVGYMAPLMGLPKMSPPEMLSGMLGISVALGWVMHFMIGAIFAIAYGWFFIGWVHKIHGRAWKGLIFGLAVFVFAQIMMAIMGAMMPMPSMRGNMMLMMLGSLIGHLVYGLIIGLMVTEKKTTLSMA